MTSIWNELIGAEVRLYDKGKHVTRAIEAGEGEALVLIHGVGGHAEAYARNVLPLAAEGFRVLSIDLLWHGFSGKPEPFDEEKYCLQFSDQIVDLLDQMGVEKAHIEGESLGGWVAMSTALRYPDRVGKIILNTTAGVRWEPGVVKIDMAGGSDALTQRSLAALESPSKETIRRRLEWLMAAPDRVTDELVDLRYALYTRPDVNAALRKVVANGLGIGKDRNQYLTEDDLKTISHPTLVFWSDKNPGSGPDVGERIAGIIPGAAYYCMLDAAHWPQWEHPEEHDRVIANFLKA
ncbi:MAG: alpha/beta hydrolase [Dehalococcoidia bacterium]|nr:alpha/beta hydrolase [Dehalococcoidia bacterium]